MQVAISNGNELNEQARSEWKAIQSANPNLKNPYFHIEFVEEVARLRPNVKVARFQQGKEVSFWPYQEIKPGIAHPVGEKIGCLHGIVCADESHWIGEEMASAGGIAAWKFDHQLASQQVFSPYFYKVLQAPFMDLRGGFEGYSERRKEAGHTNKAVRNALASGRKLDREKGPVRFEFDCRDKDLLHLMIEWKRKQMHDTGIGDLFQKSPWIGEFTENVFDRTDDGFRGLLSVLFANDVPVAIQLGLRSGTVMHGLFFCYDGQFARYSPGKVLLMEMARNASEVGLERIEMGKGGENYKQPLASGSTDVAVGAMDSRPLPAFLHSRGYQLKQRIIDSPLDKPIRSVSQFATRMAGS